MKASAAFLIGLHFFSLLLLHSSSPKSKLFLFFGETVGFISNLHSAVVSDGNLTLGEAKKY